MNLRYLLLLSRLVSGLRQQGFINDVIDGAKDIGESIGKFLGPVGHKPPPVDRLLVGLQKNVGGYYDLPPVAAVEATALKRDKLTQNVTLMTTKPVFDRAPECDYPDWELVPLNVVSMRKNKLFKTMNRTVLPCHARAEYLLTKFDPKLAKESSDGISTPTNISTPLTQYASNALTNASYVSALLSDLVKSHLVPTAQEGPFAATSYLLYTAVTVRNNFVKDIRSIYKAIKNAMSSSMPPLTKINQKSTALLSSGAKNFTVLLNAFDASNTRKILGISTKTDNYATQAISSMAADLVQLTAQVNQSLNTSYELYNAGIAAMNPIYTDATLSVSNAVTAALTDLANEARDLLIRIDSKRAQALSANLVQIEDIENADIEQIQNELKDYSFSFVSYLNQLRKKRDQDKLELKTELNANYSGAVGMLEDNSTLNRQVLADYESNLNFALGNLRGTADDLLAAIRDTEKSTSELMASAKSNFLNTTAAFERQWAEAKIAATGNTADLSQSFINQLGSVGADSDAEMQSLSSSAASQKSIGQATLVASHAQLTATTLDVADFMSGAAVQISGQTKSMQDLLVEKKSELQSSISALGRFLKQSMLKSNGSFSLAMQDLASTISDASTPAPDPSGPVVANIASAGAQMRAQLTALMGAQDVSAEVAAKLAAAEDAGNEELFDSIMQQQIAGNKAVQNAVQAAKDAASLANSLSTMSSGEGRQALQARIAALAQDGSNGASLLRSASSSLISVTQKELSGLSHAMLSTYQTIADAAVAALNQLVVPAGVPKELTSLLAQLKPIVADFRTNLKSAWLASLAPLAGQIQLKADAVDRNVTDYQTSATSVMSLQTQKDVQMSQKYATGNILTALSKFKPLFTAQTNATMAAWMADYPPLIGQFEETMQRLQEAEINASSQLSHVLTSNLSDAEHDVMNSESAEAARVRGLLDQSGADKQINSLLAVANQSLADLDTEAAKFRKLFMTNMIAQATRTQKAAIDVTDAIRSRSEKNAAQEQLLFTNEGQSLVRATQLLDTVANQVGVALNTSNAEDLASHISSSVRSLQTAQVNLQVVNSAQSDIQDAGMNATLTAMSLGDTITGAHTRSSLLRAGLLSENSEGFANGLQATSSALDVTGGSIEAINTATANLIGAFAAQAADAEADRAAKADLAANITEISAAALAALIEMFQAQTLDSANIANSDEALIAEQKATIAALVAIFATTVDAAVNVSTSGYESLTAQEQDLASYLSNASQTVVDRQYNNSETQLKIANLANDAVATFDSVNGKVIKTLEDEQLSTLQAEEDLSTKVSTEYKTFETSEENLEIQDSDEASAIVQNLSAWIANVRKAVASDLKSLAE